MLSHQPDSGPGVGSGVGQGLGLAAFILALCGFAVLPLILGLVAVHQSRSVGQVNGFGLAGAILGGLECAAIVVTLLVTGLAIWWAIGHPR
ncbi:hypothetical protein [Psychromicrobium xiongbiense]|uniref:hypothetical protein n=1 Tax=Psychromicrobium xiongbiense TaxID=3051184 RepID=UPI0025579F74|nr:hypothetical protein [Psychromicrobium sp. YIM S02556]